MNVRAHIAPRLAASLTLLGALGAAGCGATCDRNPDEPAVRYTDGRTNAAAGTYETSPWEGPYLDFPPGRTYELVHGLGRAPETVLPYFSFDRCPMPEPCEPGDDEVSNVSVGAGNQAVIEVVDDERIVVRNDTCSSIRLRVVASLGVAPVPPGAGQDAGL